MTGQTVISGQFRMEIPDFWPTATNQENVLGQFASSKQVGKYSREIRSEIISGAVVQSLFIEQVSCIQYSLSRQSIPLQEPTQLQFFFYFWDIN